MFGMEKRKNETFGTGHFIVRRLTLGIVVTDNPRALGYQTYDSQKEKYKAKGKNKGH